MIKKTVVYKNYDGVETSEELRFHLNKLELSEMNFDYDGTFVEYIHDILEKKDLKAIYSTFKKLIIYAYGIKSEDGKSFRKSKDIRESFEYSEAFATFFYDLMDSTEEEIVSFVKGILPADIDA